MEALPLLNDEYLKDRDPKIDCVDEAAKSVVNIRCIDYDELNLTDKTKIKGLPDILSDENVPKRSCGVYSDKKALIVGKFMNNDVENHLNFENKAR
ncbi:14658_t:CDS:2 [Racocetra fulgida]|uniref:14658_t:CDS:1 n=1 Tax=Racocetra fulgida TaxID=60492 RepID=A0A9N9N8P9_9GLOM|nr:14658_t:CDS:2 [Racocetra fulgida]